MPRPIQCQCLLYALENAAFLERVGTEKPVLIIHMFLETYKILNKSAVPSIFNFTNVSAPTTRRHRTNKSSNDVQLCILTL